MNFKLLKYVKYSQSKNETKFLCIFKMFSRDKVLLYHPAWFRTSELRRPCHFGLPKCKDSRRKPLRQPRTFKPYTHTQMARAVTVFIIMTNKNKASKISLTMCISNIHSASECYFWSFKMEIKKIMIPYICTKFSYEPNI